MSVALLPAERAQYSAIIDDILASGDLQTITAKQIRIGLAEKLALDISDKKNAVSTLIMERFDNANQNKSAPAGTNGTNGVKSEKRERTSTPGVKSEASPSPTPSDIDDDAPPKKKRKPTVKKEVKSELDDESYAKMLQEQENRGSRATRGAAKGKPKKSPVKKKKKKSADKVKAEDDSEMEVGSDGEVKEKKKKGGFHKSYHLSAPLAELVGEPTLSRPQVVKKIWEYIKARDLQDPADKRQIRCDERLYAVFKTDKVHMFTMNKIISKQLYDVEEE